MLTKEPIKKKCLTKTKISLNEPIDGFFAVKLVLGFYFG
jgi:hypothetical protein